jgi:dTMP kinase
MHLLFSANRWELAKRIKNTLYQGKTVIVDRYSYSGIAYSSAKKGLSLKWCCEMEKGLPRPDLVIYLEIPCEDQYRRPGFGDERYETREMQELVRIQYERVMELSKETWLKVNVENKTPDQVLGEIILPVKRCLDSSSQKELGTLDFFDAAQL